MRRRKTAGFYDSQKRLATEHAVFDDVGHGEPVRAAGDGQGALLSSFTLLRLGSSQQAANDPAKRALLAKKEELEQKIDIAEVSESRDGSGGLQEAVDGCAAWSWRRCRRGWTNEATPLSHRCAIFAAPAVRIARGSRCRGLLVAAQAWPYARRRRPASKRSRAAATPTSAPKDSGDLKMGAGERAVPAGDAAREQQGHLESALGDACCTSVSTTLKPLISFARRWRRNHRMPRHTLASRFVSADGFDGKAVGVCGEGDRAGSEAGGGA